MLEDLTLTCYQAEENDGAGAPFLESIDEMVLSAALAALAKALAGCTPARYGRRVTSGGGAAAHVSLRVTLHLGSFMRRPLLNRLLMQRLCKSVSAATALSQLHITSAPGVITDEDRQKLLDASRTWWDERERAVLMGTHARSVASPFRLLPAALVRQVLDLVASHSRCDVRFTVCPLPPHLPSPLSQDAAAFPVALPPPPPPPPPSSEAPRPPRPGPSSCAAVRGT